MQQIIYLAFNSLLWQREQLQTRRSKCMLTAALCYMVLAIAGHIVVIESVPAHLLLRTIAHAYGYQMKTCFISNVIVRNVPLRMTILIVSTGITTDG